MQAAEAQATSLLSNLPPERRRHRICLVSDFFYPRLGGVELHQYQLAQCLIRRGHKVIVITGTYAAEAPPAPTHTPPATPSPSPPPLQAPATATATTTATSSSPTPAMPTSKPTDSEAEAASDASDSAGTWSPRSLSAASTDEGASLSPSAVSLPASLSAARVRVAATTAAAASARGGSSLGFRACATERQGVRYVTQGLKIYYVPQMQIYNQASLLTMCTFFPLFRYILLREGVEIVHGHQTTSALAHEAMLHARTMGFKVVFTDHSLFGFANTAAIHINKIMKFSLCDINHVVCVSHCSKENLVLRAHLDPSRVSVIPNAVDVTKFTPNPQAAPDPKERINIVILSRLVYRKGVDLAVEIIPRICQRFPSVHFIIGGDGNKRLLLEEMREQYQLHDRVQLLGAIPHHEVRNVLVQGHLFLNCSLTEAFCIAILEAVSCGLFVVSTKVGGVPEIMPGHMIRFAEPNVDDMVEVLSDALPLVHHVNPYEYHETVKRMYDWHDVARRTERVYDKIIDEPRPPFVTRLQRYHACGPLAGKLFCIIVAIDYLFWLLLEWLVPRDTIDRAFDFPRAQAPAARNKVRGEARAGRKAHTHVA